MGHPEGQLLTSKFYWQELGRQEGHQLLSTGPAIWEHWKFFLTEDFSPMELGAVLDVLAEEALQDGEEGVEEPGEVFDMDRAWRKTLGC